MTNEEIQAVNAMLITLHMNKYFDKSLQEPVNRIDIEDVVAWSAVQLASIGIYTAPVGSSWGINVSKDTYEKHYKKTIKKLKKYNKKLIEENNNG